MSLSQSNPTGYMSSLYPNTPSSNQTTILPHTKDAGMGGNSAAYNSNKVGGARKASKRRGPKKKRTMRISCWGGRKNRRRRTATKRR